MRARVQVTLADLLTSVLTETNELQEEGMLAYYAPWKCAVRLFPRVVSFAVDGPRANELTTCVRRGAAHRSARAAWRGCVRSHAGC